MDYIYLIKRSKKGDGNAFSEIIKFYEKDLYRVAVAMMKNDNDALDCIQDAILSAYTSLKYLEQEHHFKTWLIKILINKCNDSLNKKKKVIPYSEIVSIDEHHENTEKLDVWDAVDNLEYELKTIVILYYYEDMSIKDISESLKIPEGTAKSRLSRARKILKEFLNYYERGVM